nr:GQ-rhodopsin-like [Peronia verruculata]
MNGTTHVTPTHSHWRGQESVPSGVHVAIGVFITIVGFIAVSGNILVVWTCLRYKELRTRSNLLIINLAVGELLMCIIDFPLLAIASFHNHWPFGWIVCQGYAFLTAIAGMVTINILAVVAFDRYWAVVKRPNPGQRLTKCATTMAISFVWAYSILWALCPIWGWGAYVLDGIGTTCTFDYLTRSWHNRSFVLAMVGGNFALPFSVMLFSYARIWMAVREVTKALERESSRVAMGKKTFLRESFSSYTSMKRGCREDDLVGSEIYPLEPMDLNEINQRKHDVNCNEDLSELEDDVINDSRSMNNGCLQGRLPVFLNKRRILSRTTANGDRKCGRGQGQGFVGENSPHDTVVVQYTSGKTRDAGTEIVYSYCAHFRPMRNRLEHKKHPIRRENVDYVIQSEEQNMICKDDSNFQNNKVVLPEAEKPFEQNDCYKMPRDRRFHHGNTVFSKIRRKCNTSFGSKLFLKQHRYRLHCEHKTVKIIMFLLAAFTVAWSPYMILSMIGLFGDSTGISYLTSVIPSLVAKTSIVFNPFLYSISHPKVRKRILDSLTLCSNRGPQQPQLHHLRQFRSSSSLTNSRT